MNYLDEVKPTLAAVSLTMHVAWAAENPELFQKHYWGFWDEHKGKDITASATKGTITLTAKPAA